MQIVQSRRRFLSGAALAGAAGILPLRRARADEPALETTTVRLGKLPVICFAPQYVCEALLRADGFTDVRYVDTTARGQEEDLGRGKFDFHSNAPWAYAIAIDRELPITVVTGVHAGCYELFVHGGSGFAVAGALLAVPVAAAARFLGYIDLRTRKEGWDIQLRFLRLVAETATGKRAA